MKNEHVHTYRKKTRKEGRHEHRITTLVNSVFLQCAILSVTVSVVCTIWNIRYRVNAYGGRAPNAFSLNNIFHMV